MHCRSSSSVENSNIAILLFHEKSGVIGALTKCDFNDLLKGKGIDEVKEQLNRHRPIYMKEQENREIIPKDEIHKRLTGSVDEWERLGTIKSHAVEQVLLTKSWLDKAKSPTNIEIQTKSYEDAIKKLFDNTKVFSKVKAVAPTLAETFEKISGPPKEVRIEWLSDEYKDEFNALRSSKDEDVQYLVKYRDKLMDTKEPAKDNTYTKQLESLGLNLVRYAHKRDSLVKAAPKLGAKLVEFAKAKEKQKEISRDL